MIAQKEFELDRSIRIRVPEISSVKDPARARVRTSVRAGVVGFPRKKLRDFWKLFFTIVNSSLFRRNLRLTLNYKPTLVRHRRSKIPLGSG